MAGTHGTDVSIVIAKVESDASKIVSIQVKRIENVKLSIECW